MAGIGDFFSRYPIMGLSGIVIFFIIILIMLVSWLATSECDPKTLVVIPYFMLFIPTLFYCYLLYVEVGTQYA
jgi:hypothetical protein